EPRPGEAAGAIDEDARPSEVSEACACRAEQIELVGVRCRHRIATDSGARGRRRTLDAALRQVDLQSADDRSVLPVGAGLEASREAPGARPGQEYGRRIGREYELRGGLELVERIA